MDSLSVLDNAEQFRRGVRAYQSDRPERARDLLRAVVEDEPTLRIGTVDGSVAYWYGQSLSLLGRHQKARVVWHRAVRRAVAEDDIDVHAADAYVQSVFRERGGDYEEASEVYLRLFDDASESPSSARPILRRHVAQMQFLLPSSLREEVLREGSGHLQIDTSRKGGERLAAWWRSEDPKPSTYKNERVIEHLRRVAYAEGEYSGDDPAGLGDRGETYVRLGAPTEIRTIRFDSRSMREVINRIERSMANTLRVHLSSFPDNELWVYDDWGGTYPYLFVERGGTYEAAGVLDLIPPHLQTAMDAKTGRGGAKIDVVMEALRTALRQISVYEVGYGTEYMQIADYLARLNVQRQSREVRGEDDNTYGRSDNAALSAEIGINQSSGRRPDHVVRSTMRSIREDERQIRSFREEKVPTRATQVLDGREGLSVAYRTARFLDERGNTVFYTCWKTNQDVVHGREDGSTVVSFSKTDVDFRRKRISKKRTEKNRGAVTRTYTARDEGDEFFNVGIQWDKIEADGIREEGGGSVQISTSTGRRDSVRYLSNKNHFAVSDIVPVLHGAEDGIPRSLADVGNPNIEGIVDPDGEIGLYFEIYNQRDQSGSETYDLKYSVTSEDDGGLLRSIFGGDERKTSVETSRTVRGRSQNEYIVLNAKDLGVKEGRKVEIKITVENQDSGRSVGRLVSLEVDDEG